MQDIAIKQGVTAEEYLAFDRNADQRHQFVNGEVFAMAGGTSTHSRLAANLIAELTMALKNTPCVVHTSDMRLKSEETGTYTYADVVVVCGEEQHEGDRRDVLLNPKMVIKVLSPSTEAFDRGDKFSHYATISWVQSYILVSQDKRRVEQYVRGDNGHWDYSAVSDGDLLVEAIEVTLQVDDIYRKTAL